MKIVLLSLLFPIMLFSHEHTDDIKAEILKKVFTEISLDKEIVIWSDNKNLISQLKSKTSFTVVPSCEGASLVVLEDKQNIDKECLDKPIFVMNYSLLKEIPQSFGALFWKKGRPNIVIIAPRAKERAIGISKKLDEYVEEKIW